MSFTINFRDREIDLTKVVRIYPAVVVEFEGEKSEMSLQWAEENMDRITILEYVLNIDYSQNRSIGDRFTFATQEELLEAVQELYGIIKRED